MEDLLFTNRSAERFLLTLQYFCDRSAICELGALKELSNKDVLTTYNKKEEKMNSIIVKNLKDFLPILCCTRGENDCGGGRRSMEDQKKLRHQLALWHELEIPSQHQLAPWR